MPIAATSTSAPTHLSFPRGHRRSGRPSGPTFRDRNSEHPPWDFPMVTSRQRATSATAPGAARARQPRFLHDPSTATDFDRVSFHPMPRWALGPGVDPAIDLDKAHRSAIGVADRSSSRLSGRIAGFAGLNAFESSDGGLNSQLSAPKRAKRRPFDPAQRTPRGSALRWQPVASEQLRPPPGEHLRGRPRCDAPRRPRQLPSRAELHALALGRPHDTCHRGALGRPHETCHRRALHSHD